MERTIDALAPPACAAEGLSSCPCCVEGRLTPSVRDETFEHRTDEGRTVEVHAKQVPYESCPSCGKVFVVGATLRARHDSICRTLGLLTPSEIRALRERHGLTQAEFAKITGVGEAWLLRE